MNELMQARTVITKKMNVMVRKIDGVSSFVLAGNDEYTPEEVYYVVGTAEKAETQRVYADLNFLVREFLRPIDIQKTESEGRMLVNYTFDNGLKMQTVICCESDLPAFGWWVLFFDRNGAAQEAYPAASRKPADPTTERPLADTDGSDRLEDDFDDESAVPHEEVPPVPAPETSPQPAPSAEQTPAAPLAPEPGQPDTDLWDCFYEKMNVAKHAISGGSLIYAGEIIGKLRTLLIRLMCEAEGITEDYLHSIDLLPESYRSALARTYPAGLGSAQMISALAAEHSIFEKLMQKTGR